MKVLAVNAGSSSLKFKMFEMPEEKVIISGRFERIGDSENSFYSIETEDNKYKKNAPLKNHSDAVEILIQELYDNNVIDSLDDLSAVSHRLVHGGDKYPNSVILDNDSLKAVESFTDLAPLHVPANVMCVRAFMEKCPKAVQVGCFDTAFHQTIDKERYIYPVPYEWYEKYKVRKYGFHGTSHRYIAETVKKILKKDNFKLISCHIGSGGSVCAIKDGKCVDTSMGFTPLAGIMMGTRSGDIDPSIIPYVMEKEGKNASEIVEDLNKQSGVLGLSELCSDMRDLVTACDEGNPQAIIAKNKYVRRVVDYIAQYYVLLGGADIIVFTAGVGENNIAIRREICEKLSCLGIKIDLDLNNVRGEETKISTKDSSVLVYTIPTNEELMIARDTLRLMNR